ncbi:hypothetical protein ACIREE_26175 [Streptomyces sp. NPDC102467]|uniref:hypothetical protein n=1 Tax=Streptomyces sp. NPDC102467 TaxID=3366179 RepID=UPI00380E1F03
MASTVPSRIPLAAFRAKWPLENVKQRFATWVTAVADGDGRAPVEVRRLAGLAVLQLRGDVGPFSEPRIARLLAEVIREDIGGVVIGVRHSALLGTAGLSLLELARILAAERNLPVRVVFVPAHRRADPERISDAPREVRR